MAASATMPVLHFEFDKETEPEIVMPEKQRAIVDALFEESHYESGIQALDRLRSPRYRPTVAHIRQLVYMSLYPPESIVDIPVTASPRKLQQHRQKRARMPSEEASRLSTNLLGAFVRSNGPHALFQAIPHYRDEDDKVRVKVKAVAFADVANMDETVNQEMEDSPIGKEARLVGQGKDCWALLEPNVIRRKGRPVSDYEEDTDDESASMKSVVGSHSWPLLEVFVDALEEDEKLHEHRSGHQFSPILLKNIPRMKPPQPWDVGRPVNVVFSSILSSQNAPGQPYHPHHAQLGIRLLSLLVNATRANEKLSSDTLVQLCVKLIEQPYCLSQHLQFLLIHLSSSPEYDVFVVALVCALLEGAVVVQSHGKGDDSSTSFKPVPKAKPRQRLPGAGTQPSASGKLAPTRPYPLPSLNVVLRHLASSSVTPQFAKLSKNSSSKKITPARLEIDAQKSAVAKMHLLQSLNRIMSSRMVPRFNQEPGSLSYPEWRDALRTRKVRQAVETGFCHVTGLDTNSKFQAFMAPACLEIVEDLEGSIAAASQQDVSMGD